MKSERRHELEKNELADRLAHSIESTRSFLPIMLGILAVLVVVAIVWGIVSNNARKSASVAWTEFYFNLTGGDAESFADLAEEYPRSSAAGWSRQIAGDDFLRRGIETLYRDKSEGEKLVKQAIDEYEQVERAARSPELRAKALLGLGQAHESLAEIDKAAGYYQQLAKAATQPGLMNEANERIAFLSSESGKTFYSWFKQLDPKPDAPVTLPSDFKLPPSSPDLEFAPTTEMLGSEDNAGLPLGTESSSSDADSSELGDATVQPPQDIPDTGVQPPAVTEVPPIDPQP